MKRFILIILAVLTTATTFAQNKHIDFEGIVLDGDAYAVADTIAKQMNWKVEEGVLLSGEYYGIKCDVLVRETKATKTAYSIYLSANLVGIEADRIVAKYIERYGMFSRKIFGDNGEYFWNLPEGYININSHCIMIVDGINDKKNEYENSL